MTTESGRNLVGNFLQHGENERNWILLRRYNRNINVEIDARKHRIKFLCLLSLNPLKFVQWLSAD